MLNCDMSYICRRKTNSTKKDAFFKEPKKTPALAGLDTCGQGLMFLMSFIFFLHGLTTPCALYIYNISFAKRAKSLYFTWRFEFPACAKLFGSTITFFSVSLLFYFKDDLTSLMRRPRSLKSVSHTVAVSIIIHRGQASD